MINDIELAALRYFSDPHDGGCQSPHGGHCSCGWNMIEARLAELRGESPTRVFFLRSTVKYAYSSDETLTLATLAKIDAMASASVSVNEEACNFMRWTRQQAQPCPQVFPDNESEWCGKCLLRRYEAEK